MIWKPLKLIAVALCVLGIAWFVGGQHGFVIGGFLFLLGLALFIICRIFEPTIVKIDKKQDA
jgi:hypothetical protein